MYNNFYENLFNGKIRKAFEEMGKNKKSSNLSDLRIFLPTEVVRTGIEPVFHP